jgi:hypothetical protein
MRRPADRPLRRSCEWDQGFAGEPTASAWQRSAITYIAVGALVVRAGIVERLLAVAIPTAALILLAGLTEWLFTRRIYADHQDGAPVHGAVLALLGTVTLIAAGASVALALAG